MKVYIVKSKKADGNNKVEFATSKAEASKAHNAVKAEGGTLEEKDFPINSTGILEALKAGVELAQVEMIQVESEFKEPIADSKGE